MLPSELAKQLKDPEVFFFILLNSFYSVQSFFLFIHDALRNSTYLDALLLGLFRLFRLLLSGLLAADRGCFLSSFGWHDGLLHDHFLDVVEPLLAQRA